MMKKYILPLLTGAALMLAACTDHAADSVATRTETDGNATRLAFTAKDFIPADGQSRTAFIGNTFNWIQTTDTIGILPDAGAQVYFVINDLTEDAKSATFTGQAWGLKPANDYTAYYPFIQDIMLDRDAVPVDYSVQSFKYRTIEVEGVETKAVCPSHDYMAAQSETTADGESLNFQFSHLGALVNVSFTLPEAAEVKRFYLSADEAVFPVKGTFDLTPEAGAEVAITPDNDNLAYTVTVHVEDLETTTDDKTVTLSFMMPPMSLQDVNLYATVVYGADNTTLPLTVSKERTVPKDGETEYTQFEAGKSYTLQATADEGLPGSFEIVLNNLSYFINNALVELGGTKFRFVTGSQVASDIYISDSNYDDDTDLFAYAVRNGDWLEVHTSASAVKVMDESAAYMFDGTNCYHFSLLQEIDLRGLDTSNVTDMRYMFNGCSSLTSLDISKLNTSNVTDMSYMFQDCEALTSINFGENFDTQKVEYMNDMFYHCSSLESLDLSKFNTSNVTDMNDMFYHCSSLTLLDLSKFDTSNVTDMSYMFQSCEALTFINFGENFDTQKVANMTCMFEGCYALTSLDLSGFSFSGNPECPFMFNQTGSKATNKPISIYVTSEGKTYLESLSGEQSTDIDSDYAQLVVKATLDGQDGGSW